MAHTNRLLLSALVGLCMCFGEVRALCSNMEATCLERAQDVHTQHITNPNDAFRNCEVLVTVVNCVEEFVCTCNVTIDTTLDEVFTQTYNEYYQSCYNVTGHVIRQSRQLYCLPPPSDLVGQPDQPIDDLESGDVILSAEITELDQRLLKECQGYYDCSLAYQAAVSHANQLTNYNEQLLVICQAHRFNIVCMSDAFCTCQEAEEPLLIKTMNKILLLHEQTCQEQMNFPVLHCSGATPMASVALLTMAACLLVHLLHQSLHLAFLE